MVLAVLLLACGGPGPSEPRARTLLFGAYTAPREVYRDALLPAFSDHWRRTTGDEVRFRESYQGSGALSRAVVEGFEADVVALALAPDVERLVESGLVAEGWDDGPTSGMVTRTIVVLAVRPGNPEGIFDWADLAREGVDVITPNARTSGGAMWNVAALWGAALRGRIDGVPADDPAAAQRFLSQVVANVKVMDKGARESMVTFEAGVGDVAITYESEVLAARAAGQEIEQVVPPSTLLVESPVAVVDRYARQHGREALARGFVDWLVGPEAQAAFAEHGFRPVTGEVSARFATPPDLFTIRDLGGWEVVKRDVFGKGGWYDRAVSAAQGRP